MARYSMFKVVLCCELPKGWLFPCVCRHQGFGVLSVILANHAVKLLTSLFQDLQVEALHKVRVAFRGGIQGGGWPAPGELAGAARSGGYFLVTQDMDSLLMFIYLQGWETDGPPAALSITAQSTSIQRVQRLIDSVPLTNLLLTLLSTSYRKVGGVMPWVTGKVLYKRNFPK